MEDTRLSKYVMLSFMSDSTLLPTIDFDLQLLEPDAKPNGVCMYD